jgi:DNA invertase Pin-like site-specific DNA recombinase
MSKANPTLFNKRSKIVREGAAIVRVSTLERGRTQFGSLQVQETLIHDWEKRINAETGIEYKVVRAIKDKKSAKREHNHRRRELMQLVPLIELGAIDFIVVEKLDRLSRDEIFNLELAEKIKKHNVELFFIEGGKIDFQKQGDRWRYKLDNIRAGEYSEELSEKVLRKQRVAMVEVGKDPSPNLTLGLDKHPELKGRYEINRKELKTVVDIMQRFCELGGSREGTLKYCEEKGYKTKQWWTEESADEHGKIIKPRLRGGRLFDWEALMALLTNPKYRGFNRFHDSFSQYEAKQDAEGYVTWEYHHHREHGDIIPPALLRAVDDLAAKADYKSRESEFMLSGLLRGPNGSRYGGEFTAKKKYYYNRKLGKRFGAEELDKRVFQRLAEYVEEKNLLQGLLTRMTEHKDFGLHKIRQQIEWTTAEISKLERASLNFSETIRNAAAEGSKDLAAVVQTLLKQKEQGDQELLQHKATLESLGQEEARFREAFKGQKLQACLRMVLGNFATLQQLEQKRILRSFIPYGLLRTEESGEAFLDLYINLNPTLTPLSNGRGRPSLTLYTNPNPILNAYSFPETDAFELPAAAGAENDKGHFSSPALGGLREEKWPYIKIGRGRQIRTVDLLLPKQTR